MSTVLQRLTGLIAAPFTALHADGSLNLNAIEKQAARLIGDGVTGAFICGSTGEGHSLSVEERLAVAKRWREVTASTPLRLIVHAGHNSLEEAKRLAAHAAAIRADAVSLMAPSYYKPATVDDLVDFCARVAAQCPAIPFYYYDIPTMTGVSLSMPEFLPKAGSVIPNFAGLKFTHTNLMALQQCLACEGGRFNVFWGFDEMLLAALALGVHGAVGSTYNYCAPLYLKIMAAHGSGDLSTARALQLKSVRLVEVLLRYGLLAAGKAAMSLVGVDCGPVRPPVRPLPEDEKNRLFKDLEALGIFG